MTPIEISEYYRTCDPYQGNLYSWTDLKFKTVGTIKIQQSEFCKPCDQNLTIDNANIIYGDQTAFVKCSEGFQLVGSPFVFCLRTSKWELAKLPTCKIIKCNPLRTPTNGRLMLTKISYKGQARFTCDDGFSLVGKETIMCMATGNWSNEVPVCRSIFECSALTIPANGALIYASDSGVIDEKLPTYTIGTFVEIKCNPGYVIDGENLISCIDQGTWDFEVEDCQPDGSTTEAVTMEFWSEFKEFLFYSCNSKNPDGEPKLCDRYTSDHKSLSSFELPETPEYEGMDSKLSKLLSHVLASAEFNALSVENFMETLLQNLPANIAMGDSYRFVICLYIDLILLDDELYENGEDATMSANINDINKHLLRKIALPIYKNQL